MTWRKRRRLRKYIKNVDFSSYLLDKGMTGEYRALLWLRYYIKGESEIEPMAHVKDILLTSLDGINADERLYLLTILEWC